MSTASTTAASTSGSTAARPVLTMKSVDEVIDEGLKDNLNASIGTVTAASEAPKRASVEDETQVQPKKQFKRRNVALYSALGADAP